MQTFFNQFIIRCAIQTVLEMITKAFRNFFFFKFYRVYSCNMTSSSGINDNRMHELQNLPSKRKSKKSSVFVRKTSEILKKT